MVERRKMGKKKSQNFQVQSAFSDFFFYYFAGKPNKANLDERCKNQSSLNHKKISES
jgi:hypothetical protein